MSEYYWVPDKIEIYKKGQLIEKISSSGLAKFRCNDGERQCKMEECEKYDDENYSETEDMITISDVNRATILECTRTRFFDNKIYTSLGSVLMLINPFKRINSLYGPNVIKRYSNPYEESQPSHIYNIPSRAYEAIIRSEKSQSILISGESGAGKTEATKECLTFLTSITSLNQTNSQQNIAFDVANRIIASSPIMEAFGNAQTIKNPNSSRFGKWMELRFDKSNKIVCSKIESYLLEKSRVTKHDSKERNYHIFYQLIRGADQETLKELKLSSSSLDYHYLCGMHGKETADLDDKSRYKETTEAFRTMGFNDMMIKHILRMIAAVLHLGNINITSDASDSASISAENNSLTIVSNLLNVEAFLLKDSMTTTTITSASQRRSIIRKALSVERAIELRNSVAREIFDRLFRFIIDAINNNANKRNSIVSISYEESEHYIGLLDIFGFEIFEINSMEQLCINYCNEILQNYFNHVIFEAEKQLYLFEGITCTTISCNDNTNIINEIQLLFKALDEESKIPKGNSITWYEKQRRAAGVNSKDKDSAPVKYPPSKNVFIIKHYAGNVEYLPNFFMEKNTESLSHDIGTCLSLSTDDFMQRMCSDLVEVKGERRTLSQKSITFKFQGQLQNLINMLKLSDSHFIRCVKSNDQCKPLTFDASLVNRQLLYLGIFEVVKIQQSGLPCRMSHNKFIERFKLLIPCPQRWEKVSLQKFMVLLRSSSQLSLDSAQCGKNLLFCKGPDLRSLESKRFYCQYSSAIIIQKTLRRWINRYNYMYLLLALDEFNSATIAVDKSSAEGAGAIILAICETFSILSGQNLLEYLINDVQASLNLMDDRIILVVSATSLLNPKRQSDYESIHTVIAEAEKLGISENPTIKKSISLYEPYEIAIKGIPLVEPKNIETQTLENIEIILNSLKMFTDVIKEAADAYTYAKRYKESIEHEILSIYRPMLQEYEKSLIKFDFSTLVLVSLLTQKPLTEDDKLPLKKSVEGVNLSTLRTVEAKTLFQDVSTFLLLRDQVYVDFDFVHALNVIDEYHPHYEVTKDQLLAFKEWGNFYMSCTMLPNALSSGFVKDTELEGIPVAGLKEIKDFLKIINTPINPPPKLMVMKRLVSWVVTIRESFNDKNFELLENIIKSAEHDHITTNIFLDYPICLNEIDNYKRHIQHNNLINKLTDIVKDPVFSTYSIDLDHQDTVLKNINKKCEDINIACTFAKLNNADETCWPRLLALVILVEDLLQIYQLVEKKHHGVDRLFDDLFKAHSIVLKRHELFDILQKERTFCSQILSFQLINDMIDNGLRQGTATEFHYCESTPIYDPSKYAGSAYILEGAYHQFIEWQNSQEILGCYKDLPLSIKNKIAIAENILAGRQSLVIDEYDDHYNWEDTIHNLSENSKHIDPFPDEYYNEYDVIIRELKRRKVIKQLRIIISTRCIVGSIIAGVSIDNSLFKECQSVIDNLNATMTSDIPSSPLNILSLHKIATTIMELRLAVMNNLWSSPKTITDIITRIKTYGHHISLLSFPTIPSLSQEIELVIEESFKQLLIQQLKEALEKPRLGIIYNKDNSDDVVFQADLIEKRVDAIKKFSSCQECSELIGIGQSVVSLFNDLNVNKISPIDKLRVEGIIVLYKKFNVNCSVIESLFDLLSKSIQTPDEMITLLGINTNTNTNDNDNGNTSLGTVEDISNPFLEIYLEPARRVLGLYNSKTTNSWVSIVENASSIDHSLEPLEKFSKGTVIEEKCLQAFRYICRQGYQLALHIKTKDDETKKLEALLSPKSFERKKVARRRLSSWYLDDKRGDILNEDKYNPYGIFHLREAGYDDSTIIGMNFPLKLLWAANVCPLLLRTKGKYSAMKLKVAGYTCSEVYGAGYSIEQLKQAGFSAADLYDTGASCQDLKFVGFDADTILRAGYSINQMKLAGFSLTSLHKAGADVASLVAANFSLAELRAIGLNATQLRKGGVDNPTSLRNAGYSLSNLKAAGFTSIELKKAGYSYDDLKDVGFDDIQLSSSGFHDSDTSTNTKTNTHLFSLYIDAERKALVDLWLSTGGPKWKNKTNWNSAKPLSEWFGITVNGRGHVTKVILPSNNLQGSIPDSIHLLSYVKEIDMRMNQLSGPIPDTIGDLMTLTILRLHCNRLNCKIPQAVGRLQDISILDLRSNQLSSTLPLPFYDLKKLTYLGVSSNVMKFNGNEIKSNMPWLTKLT